MKKKIIHSETSGRILVIATPIGNLADISPRAIESIKTADLLLCESVSRARKLLSYNQISVRKLFCLREDSSDRAVDEIIQLLLAGNTAALISDAGTPLISDPGNSLLEKAFRAGITVSAVPGPSALSAALSMAPFGPKAVFFLGFLPRSNSAKIKLFTSCRQLSARLVFFEAPTRIKQSLQFALQVLGPKKCLIAREISKMHEESHLTDLAASQNLDLTEKGEFTIVISQENQSDESSRILQALTNLTASQQAKVISKLLGLNDKETIDLKARQKRRLHT